MDSQALAKKIAKTLAYQSERQPGALLLCGGWGAGKSYFWNNQIVKALDQEPKVYLSLFGIKSVDELKNRLASAVVAELGSGKETWAEKLVANLPKLAHKTLTAVAKKKLGDEAAEILKDLNLSIDPLTIFPPETIVCFDDLERSKIEINDLLSLVSFLIEQKSARVLLIANEEYLYKKGADESSVYKAFKEKVVWQTIGFEVPLDEVFDEFVDKFASAKKREVRSLKNLILGTLKTGGCRNLRTLQKIIRSFDYLFSLGMTEIEECYARFFIALIDEDSTNGLSHKPEVYAKNYHQEIFDKKGKATATDEATLSGKAFYYKYFKDTIVVGFSEVLFNFVRHGVLDKDALIAEIGPEESKLDAAGRLCREYRGPWRLGKDDEIRDYGQRVYDYLKTDGRARPHVLIQLYGASVLAFQQLDETPPADLESLVKNRLEETYKNRVFDRASDGFQINNKEEDQVLTPMLAYSREAFEKSKVLHARNDCLGALRVGKMPGAASMHAGSYSWVLALLSDSEVLNVVDASLEGNPSLHEAYYRQVLERGIGARDWPVVKTLLDRLEKSVASTSQKGTKKRLSVLMDSVKSQLPVERQDQL